MTELEMLKIVADIGPEGLEAFNSWMTLQWAQFGILAVFIVGVLIVLFFVLFLAWRD